MKMVSKIMALALALVLAISAVAFAEENTTYCTYLDRPVLEINGTTIDMSKLYTEIDFDVTDGDQIRALVRLFTGESNSDLTTLFDLELGLFDGKLLGKVYGIDQIFGIDLEEKFGIEIGELVDSLDLRSTLATLSETVEAVPDYNFETVPLSERIAQLEAVIDPLVTSTTETNGQIVKTIEYNMTYDGSLIAMLAELAEEHLGFSNNLMSLLEGVTFDYTSLATITIAEDYSSCNVEFGGVLSMNDSDGNELAVIPLTFEAFADSESGNVSANIADILMFSLSSEPYEGDTNATKSTRNVLDVALGTYTFNLEFIGSYHEDTQMVDFILTAASNLFDTTFSTSATFALGENDNSYSYKGSLNSTDGSIVVNVAENYTDESITDADERQHGLYEIRWDGTINDTTVNYGAQLDVQRFFIENDEQQWTLTADDEYTDVLTMDDLTLSLVSIDLLGVAGELLETLQTEVPDLYNIVSGMVGTGMSF